LYKLSCRGSLALVNGLTARRGPKKARRGPEVQRGPNFKFNPGPRSALDHAQPTHMQCICNLNKIENAQLLILNCKYPSVYALYMPGICRIYADTFNIIFKFFKKDYSYICLVYIGHMPSIYNLLTYTAL